MSSTKFSQFPSYGEVSVGSQVVGLSSTNQDARFDFPGTGIRDANGTYLINWQANSNSNSYLVIGNAARGSSPYISVAGEDFNVNLTLTTQGSGSLILDPAGGGFVKMTSTNAFQMPAGDTAQRPILGMDDPGFIRYNTDSNVPEYYNNSNNTWYTVANTSGTVSAINGTLNRITISGPSTNPIIDIASTYVGQTSLTTIGTITIGTWQGTILSPTYGGTGLNNGSNTLSVTANSAINQDVSTTASPSFQHAYLTGSGFASNFVSSLAVNTGAVSALLQLTEDSELYHYVHSTINKILQLPQETSPAHNGLTYWFYNAMPANTLTITTWVASGTGATLLTVPYQTWAQVILVEGSIDGAGVWIINPTVTALNGTANEINVVTSGAVTTVSIADNVVLPGAGGNTLSKGTVAQRAGAAGTIRFNTDSSSFEATTDGSTWNSFATGSGTVLTVSGTANRITISGTVPNPIVDIASTYVGQISLTTLGTITTGTWNGSIVSPTYGGTGVNNGAKTITLGGNLTTSGAFNSTFTMTGTTSVTFPTSGTLATTAGVVNSITGTVGRIVINGNSTNPIINIDPTYVGQTSITTLGTVTTGTWQGTVIDSTYGGTGLNNAGNTLSILANSIINQDVSTLGHPAFQYVFVNYAGYANNWSSTLQNVTASGGNFYLSDADCRYIYVSGAANETVVLPEAITGGQQLGISYRVYNATASNTVTIAYWAATGPYTTLTTVPNGTYVEVLLEAQTGDGKGTWLIQPNYASTTLTPGSIVYAGTGGVFTQDNANLFWDATNHHLNIGTNTGAYQVTVKQNSDDIFYIDATTNHKNIGSADLFINHTSGDISTRAIYADVNAAGFGDTHGLNIDFVSGSLTGVSECHLYEANIDPTGASASSKIVAMSVTQGGTNPGNSLIAVQANTSIDPIEHYSGTYISAGQCWYYNGSTYTDITTGTHAIFSAQNDYIYIGVNAIFSSIKIILSVGASNGGVQPRFTYWNGSAWTSFAPADGTNGFRDSGVITFSASSLTGWALTPVNGISAYYIRIIRNKNSLVTSPTETSIQISRPTRFYWNATGDVSINTLTLSYALTTQYGGTGTSSFNSYGVVCGGTSPTNPLQSLSSNGNIGQVLTSNGSSALPSWQDAANSLLITQSAHGFVVGNWLYFNGTAYAKAYDTSLATAEVIGVVTSVVSSSQFTLSTGGHITGLSGLTAGTIYFLSQTPGALTSTQETTIGYIDKPLLIADSTTSGYFTNYRGEVVPNPVFSVTTATIGTLTVTTALNVNSGATSSFLNTTNSSNYTNGSVTLAGGMGITKNLNIGGNFSVAGTSSFSDKLTISANGLAVTGGTTLNNDLTLVGNVIGSYAPMPGGRLTLTSATPVTTSNVTGGTLYYTPYNGNILPLYNGTNWTTVAFSQMSVSLSGFAVNCYDIFCYLSGGTPTLYTLAWTNVNTRATSLTRQSNGLYTLSTDQTKLYLGSIYVNSTGSTADGEYGRYVWNMYNRRPRGLFIGVQNFQWSYSGGSYRLVNNGAFTGSLSMCIGLIEDMVAAQIGVGEECPSTGSNSGGIAFGVNSTTVIAANTMIGVTYPPTASMIWKTITFNDYMSLVGLNYLYWLEASPSGVSVTWGATSSGYCAMTGTCQS